MKRVYERPVMMTEMYETNAYCSNCGFKEEFFYTSADGAKNSVNDRDGWQASSRFPSITAGDLSHKFPQTVDQTSTGLCGGYGQQCDNVTQPIWRCVCHPDDPWYLEWSHYYSTSNHGSNSRPANDTFFLYKEATGDKVFNITPNSTNFPAQEDGTDINVAVIVRNTGNNVIVNS